MLKLMVAVPLLLALALWIAGQAGLLRGSPPADLGVQAGRLKPPSATPNSVSSQADLFPGHPQQAYARIAPLPAPAGAAELDRIRQAALALPGASLVQQQPGYLRIAFQTRWLGFVDDAEFWFDPAAGVVQLRSASRLGQRDFGVNRQRIEALRAQLARG